MTSLSEITPSNLGNCMFVHANLHIFADCDARIEVIFNLISSTKSLGSNQDSSRSHSLTHSWLERAIHLIFILLYCVIVNLHDTSYITERERLIQQYPTLQRGFFVGSRMRRQNTDKKWPWMTRRGHVSEIILHEACISITNRHHVTRWNKSWLCSSYKYSIRENHSRIGNSQNALEIMTIKHCSKPAYVDEESDSWTITMHTLPGPKRQNPILTCAFSLNSHPL